MADRIARSVEMEDAEYFLALWRHQHNGALPPVLGTQELRQAILVFFKSCGDGRDEAKFCGVFSSGMRTFADALPDCRDMKPRQQATRARAAGKSLEALWKSLRERCRLTHLPALPTPAGNVPTASRGNSSTAASTVPPEPNLAPTTGADGPPPAADNRTWTLRLIADRRGQTAFRAALLRHYKRCVVTDCGVADVLEAAHIRPYANAGDDEVANGLLLRADIHTLFDLHLVGINPDTLLIEWHPRVAADPFYRDLAASARRLPTPQGVRPQPEALAERNRLFRECLARP